MSTYLINWNPKKWSWEEPPQGHLTLEQSIEKVRRKGFVDDRWSCGNTKKIQRGARVFLIRLGLEPRGIMASGIVTREPYEDVHWDPKRPNDTALCIDVRFYALLHPKHDGVLAIEKLQTKHLTNVHWFTQAGGIRIPPPAAEELEAAWSAFLMARGQPPISIADEVTTPERFFEGATRQISVNIYERNPTARRRCIEKHGCRCSVCDFDFEKAFGDLGRGFIHVHHLEPLSEIQEEYEIDPIADLRPICPNCHAMIHRNTEMMSIKDLRELIQSSDRQLEA